jgi:hypothetical protein
MPRKMATGGVPNVTVKVSPSTESEGKPEDKPEEPSALAEEQRIADEAIEQSTAGAITRAVAWIWRVGKDGTKAYVGGVAPDLVTNEFLLENCGGGVFQVDYRRPRKAGGTEQSTSRRFLIDGPPKIPPWATVPASAAPSPNGTIPNPVTQSMNDVLTTGVLTVVKSMQDASTTNSQLTQAAIERLREPKPEGWTAEKLTAVAVPIVTAFASVAAAIINRPVPAPPDPTAIAIAIAGLTKQKDPAEVIAALAPILRPPPGPPADVTQLGGLISALKGLVDLKDSLSPGNGSSDTGNAWVDLGRDVAKALPEVAAAARVAMQQRQANQPPGGQAETLQAAPGAAPAPDPRRALSPGPGEPMGPPRAAAAASATPETIVPESNGAQTEEAMLRVFLKGISDQVIVHAKAKRPPQRIASSFLDLHEQYLDQIAWWVEQPNCVQNFLRDFPEWMETPELKRWLEEFIQQIDKETHEAPQT